MQQADLTTDGGESHGRIGPYRLLRVLGEGGMGIVYEAEELGSVRRRVALKLIKPGFASRASTARIEAERQALAVMNHPAIATVFHAGATDDGQPYFAMELANGSRLNEFCDAHRLTVRERLELFLEVCRGVQHAHQKGVIHRDLKPSNVLVVEQEGRAQPKIIDFGIAKALGQQLTESTLVTQQGQALGTAAYMSPEQAGESGLDVDTRADIYSLGVILYQLLTGELPVNPATVGAFVFIASLASGQLNPLAPSERLRDLFESRAVAHQRRTDSDRLVRTIRGDLDTIVMKALEPDRSRRYETVNALAMDIHRYLANEPILARPPGTGYRMRKFVRRHRTAALGGGLAAIALLLGSIATTVGMVRATAAERVAAQEAVAAQQVTEVLVGMFEATNPFGSWGPEVTAREVLESAPERIRRELAGQPRLYARVMHTMGRLYTALGVFDRAEELLEEALRVREREYGPSHPEVAVSLNELGHAALEQMELVRADSLFSRAATIAESVGGSDASLLARPLGGLGGVRVRQGRYAEAESLYLRVRELEGASGRQEQSQLSQAAAALATVYAYQGKLSEAEELLRQLLAAEERLYGPDHASVAVTLTNLGVVYYEMGRYPQALSLYQRAGTILQARLGDSHQYVGVNLNNQAEVHWKLGRHSEAERLFRRALVIGREVAESSPLATTLNGLAGVLRDQRRYAEAEPLYREALAIRERLSHPRVGETLLDYAQLLRAAGREGEAIQYEERAGR